MATYPLLERIAWFDQQVRSGRYPNTTALCEKFEITRKTAQRAIDFLRDRWFAPLAYDPARRGYWYEDLTYQLPPAVRVSQDEVLALLIARKVLEKSPDNSIAQSIRRFSEKLIDGLSTQGVAEERVDTCFSACWIGMERIAPDVFDQVVFGLTQNRCMRFTYRSPGTQQTTQRNVEPHHLQYYMGNWVLIAWCSLRSDWRRFYLSRMSASAITERSFKPKPREVWGRLVEDAFGIFQGGTLTEVTLRFSSFQSRWIREQLWHPQQVLNVCRDGCAELTLPVSDFREIKMKILSFGADVEVLKPEALKDEIRAEIKRMTVLYGQDSNS
jgi:predicted DNA-binding transcriptional regulator YafY